MTKTPIQLLERAGVALYGPKRWHRPLAADLNIHKETLRRWRNGSYPLQADNAVFLETYALLRKRQNEIGAAADLIMTEIMAAKKSRK